MGLFCSARGGGEESLRFLGAALCRNDKGDSLAFVPHSVGMTFKKGKKPNYKPGMNTQGMMERSCFLFLSIE